jgi:hypothetical protein
MIRKYTRESTPQLTLLEKEIHERINTTAYTTREGNTRENQHHSLHYKRRKYTRESTPQLTLLEKEIHERINTTTYTTREGNTRENQHHSLHY